jgi:PASTA domain
MEAVKAEKAKEREARAQRAAEQERARVEAARASEQDQIAEPKPEAGEDEPKTVHWGEHLFEHEIKPVQAERGELESSRRGRKGEIASTRGMKKRLTQSRHGAAVRGSQEARPIQKNAPSVPERAAAPKAPENGAQDHWRSRVLAGIATGVIALTIGVGAVLLSTRGTPNPSLQIGPSAPSAPALATTSPATVEVPQVTGGSVSQARTQLLDVGLQFLRAVPTFGPPGVVVATDPSIGARVAPGSEVTLFVGTSPDRVGGKG